MTSTDDSFVKVGEVSAPKEFVFKIGILENGSQKYYRFVVEDSHVTFDKLSEFVESRTSKKATFTYQDVDGDQCAISKTEDLIGAINQFQDKGFLKLETKIIADQGIAPVTPPPSYEERVARARQLPEPTQDEEQRRRTLGSLEEANAEEIYHHILEEFYDHFNLDHPREFFAGEEVDGVIDVMTTYDLNGRTVKSSFFCMDDIYIDLTAGAHPDGELLVRMAIPGALLSNMVDQVTLGRSSCISPLDGALDSVFVQFDPSIDVKVMLEDNRTRVSKGALGDIIHQEEFQHFYKVSAVFMATAMKNPTSLALTLIDLVAFSEQDDVLETLMNDCGCASSDGTWNMDQGYPDDDDPAYYGSEEDPAYDDPDYDFPGGHFL